MDYDRGTGTLVPRRCYQRGAVQDPELPKPPQLFRCRGGPAGGGVDRVLVLLGRQHLGLAVTRAGPPLRSSPSGWISSGVPITEPAPDSLAHELLAQRGYRLLHDPDHSQRTRSVRRLGFVSCDAELILLAEMIRAQPIEHLEHPLRLAARWTAAGFSALAYDELGESRDPYPGGCSPIESRHRRRILSPISALVRAAPCRPACSVPRRGCLPRRDVRTMVGQGTVS